MSGGRVAWQHSLDVPYSNSLNKQGGQETISPFTRDKYLLIPGLCILCERVQSAFIPMSNESPLFIGSTSDRLWKHNAWVDTLFFAPFPTWCFYASHILRTLAYKWFSSHLHSSCTRNVIQPMLSLKDSLKVKDTKKWPGHIYTGLLLAAWSTLHTCSSQQRCCRRGMSHSIATSFSSRINDVPNSEHYWKRLF